LQVPAALRGGIAAGSGEGALKNQLQHLGEVKVLGWKKQKSSTSN
jgi:hypothetical protein